MRSFKVEMIQRREERFDVTVGSLPFQLVNKDNGEPLESFQVRNVSFSGIGIETDFHLDPETCYSSLYEEQTLQFKVVHSTFIPDTQRFRCGLKLTQYEKRVDLVQVLAKGASLTERSK